MEWVIANYMNEMSILLPKSTIIFRYISRNFSAYVVQTHPFFRRCYRRRRLEFRNHPALSVVSLLHVHHTIYIYMHISFNAINRFVCRCRHGAFVMSQLSFVSNFVSLPVLTHTHETCYYTTYPCEDFFLHTRHCAKTAPFYFTCVRAIFPPPIHLSIHPSSGYEMGL